MQNLLFFFKYRNFNNFVKLFTVHCLLFTVLIFISLFCNFVYAETILVDTEVAKQSKVESSTKTVFIDRQLSLGEILDNMKKTEDKIIDLKLEFFQEIEFKNIDEIQIIKGELFYRKPDNIMFIQKKPIEQYISLKNKKLLTYNPQTNQVFEGSLKDYKGIKYFIAGIFNPEGDIQNLHKNYKIELKPKQQNYYFLKLSPRKKNSKISFFIWIDDQTFSPRKSKFISETFSCDTEVISFEINISLDDSNFELKIPKSAQIFKLE